MVTWKSKKESQEPAWTVIILSAIGHLGSNLLGQTYFL